MQVNYDFIRYSMLIGILDVFFVRPFDGRSVLSPNFFGEWCQSQTILFNLDFLTKFSKTLPASA